jgi:D-alanine-D-alanine ligase
VLCGGPSAEREVSLDSGRAIADALGARGHRVFVWDIDPDHLEGLDAPADVIFPALHGTFGEDGTLQRLLEQRGVRFVGSGSRASALAMDKVAAKQLVAQLDIDTPEYRVIVAPDPSDGDPPPLPAVIKPIDQGSSVLTSIAQTPQEYAQSLSAVLDQFGRALVERFIDGDELTVGILGRDALPPICIRPRRSFYTYEAKYLADDTEYDFEPNLPADVLMRAQRLSEMVFAAMGCRHLGRADWIVDRRGRLWFLEMNTIPGFTGHSLVPKAAARVGINFDELTDRLVRMALEADE